ncbi:hypothetical protein BGX27_011512, partial [Mortierella sp. AM989]
MTNEITVYYLIEGENTEFAVDIASTKTVGHLKKAIKVEESNRFSNIDASRLTLWKADIPNRDVTRAVSLDDISVKQELVNVRAPLSSLGDLTGNDTYIIVKSPREYIPHRKLSIEEAFPDGLPYANPRPIISTPGVDWEYQASEDLLQTLREEVREHFDHFRAGMFDKTYMPLYLFLSGAGTGKSRNASEFHRTAIQCLTEEDVELRNRLQNAWVFHVSLESNTAIRRDENNATHAIGSRMLLQLLPDAKLEDMLRDYEAPEPLFVLRLVAKYYNQDLADSSIILVVDGMQRLMNDCEAEIRVDS